MNLKNDYLLKKLLKWVNKKRKNFNTCNVVFKKKKTPGNIIIFHLCTKNLPDIIHNSWDIQRDRLKLVTVDHFLLYYCTKTPKNQKFEKKLRRYHHFTHMCTKNYNYIMNGFWNTEWDGLNFFVIYRYFLPFYLPPLPNDQENQNLKKMKKTPRDVIILQMCTKNQDHMMYASWDMEYNRHIFCHFGPFFALLPH